MDGVIDIDKAREIVGNVALWPRVRDFLWNFVPQVHESWLSSSTVGWLGSSGMQSDMSSSQPTAQPSSGLNTVSPRVKVWLLQELGVEPCFHDFPKDDGSRLLLLDGTMLLEIAKWFGALACANVLRRITDGATVRSLKVALHGVYPEVFGYTAYFKEMVEICGLVVKWFDDADGDKKLDGEFVVAVGLALVDDALAHLSAPILRRFRLKLPRNLPPRPPLQFPRSSDHLTTHPLNLQLLLKLRFSEAYALCSS